jgi:hypothetical protein
MSTFSLSAMWMSKFCQSVTWMPTKREFLIFFLTPPMHYVFRYILSTYKGTSKSPNIVAEQGRYGDIGERFCCPFITMVTT